MPPAASAGRRHREGWSLPRSEAECTPAQALAIDLDGTLCRTDTLIEQALRLLAKRPWELFTLLPAWLGGRARLKHRLSHAMKLDPATLVFDERVVALASQAREAGREVVLATAADRSIAEAVAAHLGLFDAVFASDATRNLKGAEKALFLQERYGDRCFDYVGDSRADVPVWRLASQGFVVAPDRPLLEAARAVCPAVIAIGVRPSTGMRVAAALRALRLHQWAKNALIFVPAFAAHRWQPVTLVAGAAGFAAFSLCASSVYLLNDLLDLPHDRAHPTKCRRPFASGDLPLAWGPGLVTALLGAAIAIGLLLPGRFLLMLLGYYACTLTYSFVLKRRAIWDVMMLAGLYTVRVFAGGAATGVPVSPWLLAFSMFLFFCLAIVKRQTELTRLVAAGGRAMGGRGYVAGDLDMLRSMAAASGTMTVLVLALYVNSPDVLALYPHPSALWALCPILLFWVSRVLMLSHRGLMNEDPVVWALRDPVSLAAGAVSLAAILLGAA